METHPTPDEAATIAANLARTHGWAVFPVGDNKHPVWPKYKGGSGYKDGSKDPDRIAWLWRRWPGPLIGVSTGAMSGVSVLDIDLKHDAALAWWRANEPRLPRTRAYRTRSGGVHLYFLHATGVGCTQGKLALGVDTRGDGGYAIYWFAAGYECLDQELPAPWPLWLLPALLAKPVPPPKRPMRDYGDAAIDGVLRTVAAAPEGQRNAVLHWGACRLGERVREGQMGASEAAGLLIAAATNAGLPEIEARSTVRSGLGRTA
jgi:hypothetical protein